MTHINPHFSWMYTYNPYRLTDGKDEREIPCFEIVDSTGDRIASTNEDMPHDAQQAHASLMAAAPELLATLETLLENAEQTNTAFYVNGTTKALRAAFQGQKDKIREARAAIAKAKGGEA